MAKQMHNPPHPGEVIRELCLEPLGLSVTEAAEGLGVSRKTLSAILNGRAGISPEMAFRPNLGELHRQFVLSIQYRQVTVLGLGKGPAHEVSRIDFAVIGQV